MCSYFHLTTLPLATGSVIEPGNWKRMLDLYAYRPNDAASAWKLASEYTLERVRVADYGDRVSRMSCCFVFETAAAAIDHMPLFGQFVIPYEVEATDGNAPSHRGAFNLLNFRFPEQGRAFAPHAETIAQKYWSGQEIEVPEVLLASSIRIVRKL